MANRTISSGHGKKVSGASYYIDEVTEARKVVNRVTEICEQLDPKGTIKYHEDSASNKNSNLNNIVKYHNSTNRSLDVSIHFNSAKFKDKNGEYKLECTDSAVGTETLYKTQAGKVWAAKITTAIASAGGFKDRGIVHRTNLGFLNNTNKPAILIELCFVNSKKDVELYKKNFEQICIAIAEVLTGKTYNKSQLKKYKNCILYGNNIDKVGAEIISWAKEDCIIKNVKDHVAWEATNLFTVGGLAKKELDQMNTREKYTAIVGVDRYETVEKCLALARK